MTQRHSDQPQLPTERLASRRKFLFSLPIVTAGAAMSPATSVRVEPDGSEGKRPWSDSEHVKRFYEVARF